MNSIIVFGEDKSWKYVKELFWEYLEWANTRVNEEFNVKFDIKKMLEKDMKNLDTFLPPNGKILLTETEKNISGIGCLKKVRMIMLK